MSKGKCEIASASLHKDLNCERQNLKKYKIQKITLYDF